MVEVSYDWLMIIVTYNEGHLFYREIRVCLDLRICGASLRSEIHHLISAHCWLLQRRFLVVILKTGFLYHYDENTWIVCDFCC